MAYYIFDQKQPMSMPTRRITRAQRAWPATASSIGRAFLARFAGRAHEASMAGMGQYCGLEPDRFVKHALNTISQTSRYCQASGVPPAFRPRRWSGMGGASCWRPPLVCLALALWMSIVRAQDYISIVSEYDLVTAGMCAGGFVHVVRISRGVALLGAPKPSDPATHNSPTRHLLRQVNPRHFSMMDRR